MPNHCDRAHRAESPHVGSASARVIEPRPFSPHRPQPRDRGRAMGAAGQGTILCRVCYSSTTRVAFPLNQYR
ncbi:MAG: hypothetical protein GY820_21605, partial [Gammaproteobacteria bacterium]|nr:hypothetical protein [Gammaproteobacteria bacterium]